MAKRKKKAGDAITQEMGRRLAQSRKARGWTQAELSARTGWRQEDADEGQATGFSPSRIGNYEQGTRRFSNEEAELFGRIFDLPAAYFLILLDDREAEVIVAMRRSDPPHPPRAHPRRQRG